MRNFVKILYVKIDLFADLVKEGIKLWVNAPSAKILLKRFGSLKATKNISLYIFAPSMDALSKSLKRPNIREVSMPRLFVKKFLKIMGIFYPMYS